MRVRVPKIKADRILSIKHNSDGITMIVKTREGNGGFNGELGINGIHGGFRAFAYGNRKDSVTKSQYDEDLIFRKFADGAIARTSKKLVPSRKKKG